MVAGLSPFVVWAAGTEVVVLLLLFTLRGNRSGQWAWLVVGTFVASAIGYAAQVGTFTLPG